MIDLYYWTTPNGHKVTMFLEEAGIPYNLIPVHIGKGEQFKPEFLAIAPNNRIPAIVDQAPEDGGAPLSLFESGAILQYLAEKSGQFLPADVRGRAEVMQLLFWQMGGLGPMAGQTPIRAICPEPIDYAITRYVNETNRLYGVLNKRLADRAFVAGDSTPSPTWQSTVDRAARTPAPEAEDFPHLARWFAALPPAPPPCAVCAGGGINVQPTVRGDAKSVLFGQTAKTSAKLNFPVVEKPKGLSSKGM